MLIIWVHPESLTIMENISLDLKERSMLSTDFTTSGAFPITSVTCPHAMFMADHTVTQRIIRHAKPKKTALFNAGSTLPFITSPFTFVDILN